MVILSIFFARNCQKRSIGSQIRVGAMAADEGKMKIEKFDGADFGFLEDADRRLSVSEKALSTSFRK